jgi:hypothetical protein
MSFETRSEDNGLNEYQMLDEALEAAKKDKSIWKISFSALSGERIRLVRYTDDNKWIYQPIE